MGCKRAAIYSETYFYHQSGLIVTSLIYANLIIFQWIVMKLETNMAIIQLTGFLLFFFFIILRFQLLLNWFYYGHLIYIAILILLFILTFSIDTQFIWEDANITLLKPLMVFVLLIITIVQTYLLREYNCRLSNLKKNTLIINSTQKPVVETTDSITTISSQVITFCDLPANEVANTAVLEVSPPILQKTEAPTISNYSYPSSSIPSGFA